MSSLKTPPRKPSLDPHLIVSALLVVIAFGILASIPNDRDSLEDDKSASYFGTPTSTPMGFVPTIIPTSALLAQIQVIDTGGGINTSLVIDSNGFPVIAYESSGELKLARCIDFYCTNPLIRVLDSSLEANYGDQSLKLLDGDIPIISFYSGETQDLKLARCNDDLCTGHTVIVVDAQGEVGTSSSLALDSGGNPIIAYYDADNYNLRLAFCNNNTTCDSPVFRNLINSMPSQGLSIDLAITTSDLPRIAYYDFSSSRVRLIVCRDSACNVFDNYAVSSAVEGETAGSSVSFSLSIYDGVQIVYQSLSKRLFYAACYLKDCSNGAHISVLDNLYGTGRFNAMSLNQGFVPIVSYYDETNQDLRLMICWDGNCQQGERNFIATEGNVGSWTSAAIRNKKPIISYYDATQDQLMLYFGDYELPNPRPPEPTLTLTSFATPTVTPSFIPGTTHTFTPTYTTTFTPTPTSTRTPRPTVTPTPTNTPTNTFTPTNTATNTPTNTLTPTNTSTPITLTAPPDATMAQNFFTTRTPTLSWGRVSWAVGYRIQVDDASDFLTPLVDYDQVSAEQPSFTLVSALANGTYYWRVCAERSQGVCGAWSATERFIISVP